VGLRSREALLLRFAQPHSRALFRQQQRQVVSEIAVVKVRLEIQKLYRHLPLFDFGWYGGAVCPAAVIRISHPNPTLVN